MKLNMLLLCLHFVYNHYEILILSLGRGPLKHASNLQYPCTIMLFDIQSPFFYPEVQYTTQRYAYQPSRQFPWIKGQIISMRASVRRMRRQTLILQGVQQSHNSV